MTLKPCPCGKTPTALIIEEDPAQGFKYALAVPDCCGEWKIEFRTDYTPADSPECQRRAVDAWNDAPRVKGKPKECTCNERGYWFTCKCGQAICNYCSGHYTKDAT